MLDIDLKCMWNNLINILFISNIANQDLNLKHM